MQCEYCGKEFTPTIDKWGRESKVQRYCDRKCYHKHYTEKNKDKINTRRRKYFSTEEGKEKRYEYRKRKKEKVLEILGNKCEECGNNDERTFELHHKTKRDSGRYTYHITLKEIKDGLITLLCANCHRIIHYDDKNRRRSKYPIDIENSTPELSKKGTSG